MAKSFVSCFFDSRCIIKFMLLYVIGGHPEDPESFALAIILSVCILIVLEVLIAVVHSI